MPGFVRIAVNVPTVSGEFDYHLPPELEGQVQPGCLVSVPFGAQVVQGIVTRLVDSPEVPKTKPVRALLDPLPAVTPSQMALAQQVHHPLLERRQSAARCQTGFIEGKEHICLLGQSGWQHECQAACQGRE
jgi:primosomal protein N'